MSIDVHCQDRIAMSQRERDLLKVMGPVLQGQRTQAEAARLADLSVRQIRRIQCRLEEDGDGALVHGLRGKPSNHRFEATFRRKVLAAYRQQFVGFGPTFACEKLLDLELAVSPDTLRRWLIAEGLWQRQRRRESHRSRRPRRACYGELVQMDASIHDWLEGRGETLVLISMIDDATGRVLARFYREGTVETHMDLLGRWLRQHGRPLALYTDRHSIFEAGCTRRNHTIWPGFARIGHSVDPGTQSPGQGTRRAFLRHGPGSLGEGVAAGGCSDPGRSQRCSRTRGPRPQSPLRQAGPRP
jgi:Helix-turn-helix domain